MLTIEFDEGGTRQAIELLADSFTELRPVFATFSRWMREEIDEVFATDGHGAWPERKERSKNRALAQARARLQKIERGKYNSLRGRLRSERRRAERRLDTSLQPMLWRSASDSKLTEKRRRSVARYDAQQAELERVAAGGEKAAAGFAKLYERMARREKRAAAAVAAAERGAPLGRIAQSFTIDFDKSGWEMYSRIPWSAAHNEGATVAHNARLPARVFLEWTPARVRKFCELAQAFLIERAEKKAKK